MDCVTVVNREGKEDTTYYVLRSGVDAYNKFVVFDESFSNALKEFEKQTLTAIKIDSCYWDDRSSLIGIDASFRHLSKRELSEKDVSVFLMLFNNLRARVYQGINKKSAHQEAPGHGHIKFVGRMHQEGVELKTLVMVRVAGAVFDASYQTLPTSKTP